MGKRIKKDQNDLLNAANIEEGFHHHSLYTYTIKNKNLRKTFAQFDINP